MKQITGIKNKGVGIIQIHTSYWLLWSRVEKEKIAGGDWITMVIYMNISNGRWKFLVIVPSGENNNREKVRKDEYFKNLQTKIDDEEQTK